MGMPTRVRPRTYWAGAVVVALVYLRASTATVRGTGYPSQRIMADAMEARRLTSHRLYLLCLGVRGGGEGDRPDSPMEGASRPNETAPMAERAE